MSRLNRVFRFTAAAAAIAAASWGVLTVTAPPHEGGAGIAYGEAHAPMRDTEIDFHLWYPAEPGGRSVTVGGNGVFFGTEAGRGAPVEPGRFPLVVISHGSGGNAGQYGWIAQALAEAGYAVALPNHPGTTTGNASAEAAMRLWERPADVRAVIDAIEAAPETYPFIDTTRISTLGFSAGGFTALALVGARAEPAALNAFCDLPNGMSDCAFFAQQGIDLRAFDFGPVAEDMSDPRVRAAVVIDPGIIQTVTDASLQAITVPVQLINLGDPGTVPAGVDAAHAATRIAGAQFETVSDSVHFSFLARCKARGAAILEREGELDPLCSDGGERSRADIHAELVQRITGFLAAIEG